MDRLESHSTLTSPAASTPDAASHPAEDHSPFTAAKGTDAPVPPVAPYTADWSPHLVLALSCLSVSAAGLGGNAVRFAMENCFVKYPFFAKYNYIEPNTLGCLAMGFLATVLPPESHLPLTYRACCVGFCGSLTTFSTWMVKVMTQNSAGDAFEHLFIGGTMPIVFFLWGRDLGQLVRWCCGAWLRCPWESWTAHRSVLRAVDCAVLALLVVAAVVTPVLVQVYINKGRVRVISTDDIRMVVIAPIGAIVRFLVSIALNNNDSLWCFPLGTFLLNLSSFILAVVMFNMEVLHPSNAWLVIVEQGICGTLSTFAAFVDESVDFYRQGRVGFMYFYVFVTVGVSIFIGGIGRPQLYGRTVK